VGDGKDVNTVKKALVKYGPLAISIDTPQKTFNHYSHGIYDDPNCSSTTSDHSVLLVGYGKLDGKDYWLIKNSWSTYWGLQGYILIAADSRNLCAVMKQPTHVTVK